MNKQKGFTIIELIVVIAIIAVLAAIVLVNVTQYIAKGKNAAIEGNMATLMTNAAAYFDQYSAKHANDFVLNTATGCGGTTNGTSPIAKAISSAYGSNQLKCYGNTASQAWCGYSATLAAGSAAASNFCVDSTGYKQTAPTVKCTSTHFCCSSTCP